MTNYARCGKLVEQIKAHQDMFNMSWWTDSNSDEVLDSAQKLGADLITFELEDISSGNTTCGTTLCAAGFALLQAGWKIQYNIREDNWGSFVKETYISPDGEEREPAWEYEAAKYLDIPLTYAKRLFHYTIDDDVALAALESIAKGVPFEEIEILSELGERTCACSACYVDTYDEDEDY